MKDVKNGTVGFMNYSDIEENQTAHYLDDDIATQIPRIRFTWLTSELIYLSEAESQEVVALGYKVSKSHDINLYHARGVKLHLGKPIVNYAYFCNFRRYSWSETYEKAGEYGYAGGVVYANGWDGGLLCNSPEQVIRETLIASIHRSKVPDKIKFDLGVRPLWQRLLDDALHHVSHYALTPIKDPNGIIPSVKIIE